MKKKNVYEVYYRSSLLMMIFIPLSAVFIGGIFAALSSVNTNYPTDGKAFLTAFLVVLAIYMLCFLPFTVYYAYQYVHYHKVQLTDIQTVKLEHIVPAFWGRGVGFEITATVNRQCITASTKCIFSTHIFSSLALTDYLSKEVEVGYDANRDEVIPFAVEK